MQLFSSLLSTLLLFVSKFRPPEIMCFFTVKRTRCASAALNNIEKGQWTSMMIYESFGRFRAAAQDATVAVIMQGKLVLDCKSKEFSSWDIKCRGTKMWKNIWVSAETVVVQPVQRTSR